MKTMKTEEKLGQSYFQNFPIKELFEEQMQLQKCMFGTTLPIDSVEDFKYSILALIGELGEVLDADRRWKNVRKGWYNRDSKLDELVDCMAFLINAILYSGYSAEEFTQKFVSKNAKNFIRFYNEQEAKADANSDC